MEAANIETLKSQGKVLWENEGASVINIGDRIGLVEFHTKANAINNDICEMLIKTCTEGTSFFDALIIGNQGKHFSAGANLLFILQSAKNNNWKELSDTIKMLQTTNMTLKYGPIPIISAPFNSSLGGGCEICLHSDHIIASNTVHMGLVEAGVGLIPAGGGTKELTLRAYNKVSEQSSDDVSVLQQPFNIIATAKVSATGEEAKQLFLKPNDIIMSDSNLIDPAKKLAVQLIEDGYNKSTAKANIPVAGTSGISYFQNLITEMQEARSITDHDALIATKIATILCGGEGNTGVAEEQHFLDLEREAFLSLLGTEKTQQRIEFLLVNNKTLHN